MVRDGIGDAGIADAGIVDAGLVDAGIVDAGFVDAGTVGFVDAGTVDFSRLLCPLLLWLCCSDLPLAGHKHYYSTIQ